MFVGRGALKLKSADEIFNIEFTDKIVADVGASTGGFTEYSLNQGAKKVYCIDVGHDQLASKLQEDSRVINMEGVNIKNPFNLPEKCDLAVCDLSFISLKLVIKNISDLVSENGKIMTLVKPQFEVGKNFIGKNGIVSNLEKVQETLVSLKQFFEEQGLYLLNFDKCAITGKDGNQEYFFFIDKSLTSSKVLDTHIKI